MVKKSLVDLSTYTPKVAQPTTEVNKWITVINEVVKNIRVLIGEYKELRTAINPTQTQSTSQLPAPLNKDKDKGGNSMADIKKITLLFLTALEKQGYGDKTIGEVLNAIPLTITQVIGIVNNPSEFLTLLLAVKERKDDKSTG